MVKHFRATRVNDKIAVVIYSKAGRIAHQGLITVADLDRLQPLFRRYLTVAETAELNAAIKAA